MAAYVAKNIFVDINKFHSMIPVLLNGGLWRSSVGQGWRVSLDDTSVTEWRGLNMALCGAKVLLVSLDDTSVTEWRRVFTNLLPNPIMFHSMIPVLLNGGIKKAFSAECNLLFHSMIPVLLNGGFSKSWCFLIFIIVSLDDTSVTEWRTSGGS